MPTVLMARWGGVCAASARAVGLVATLLCLGLPGLAAADTADVEGSGTGSAAVAVVDAPEVDDPEIVDIKETMDLERQFLTDRLPEPMPEYIGTDGIYEGLSDEWAFEDEALPVGALAVPWEHPALEAERDVDKTMLLPAPDWSFDPAAIVHLPFDLTTVEHPLLLEFLEFYNTEGRTRASRWLAKAGGWRAQIEAVADELGAPRELVWIAAIESSFTPTARSRAGAVGMWQFMSVTAREYGMRIDRYVDERRDPAIATRMALQHLMDLHATFRSWPLAMAAYNAGGGHVRSEVREHNVTDFWSMEPYGCIYNASRRYALRAMALAVIDMNREVFGFEGLIDDPPLQFDTVMVPGGVRLSLLADAADLTMSELREYNPSLLLNTTPSDGEFPLRLPSGRASGFVEAYDDLADRYGATHTEDVVHFGETIADLSVAFGVPQRVIRQINGLEPDEEPLYGSVILIPGEGRVREPRTLPSEPMVLVLPPTRFTVPGRTRVFYEVHTRDTLQQIADHFEVDLYDLAAWNDLDPHAAIFSGQTLQVYVAPDFDLTTTCYLPETVVMGLPLNSAEYTAHFAEEAEPAPRAQPERPRRYTVRRGDTLSEIARRHDLSTRALMRLNDLDEGDPIRPGQTLRLR